MWRRRRGRRGVEELRARLREREAALRKARREEQLVSKRLLREDSAADEGGQDGADAVPEPLSEDEVLVLLRGVQRGSEDRKRSLVRLRQALQNEETQQKFVRLAGSIRALTGLFTSSLADMQLEAARCLHELSHSSAPTVAEACLPVTSYLLTYLSGHSVEFTVRQIPVLFAWALVPEDALEAAGMDLFWPNMAHMGVLLEKGPLGSPWSGLLLGTGLFSVTKHYNPPLKELCLYTLGNLVVESEAVRKQLLPQGIIPVLASCIQSPHEAVLEGVGYVLSQLLQAKESPKEIIPHKSNTVLLELGAVPALTSLLLDLASEIPQDAPEGLELLVCPVLRCLSNLLAETGCQVQDERLLIALFLLLQSFLQQHPFLVQEGLWLLNNLTADDPFFCSALLSLDLLPALLQLLQCSQMAKVLVLMVLCNIVEKGPAQCQQLLCQPVLPLLQPVLALPDPEAVGQCLELLHLLFLHCPEAAADFTRQGGHQALEQHQSTPELQERAQALLDMVKQPLGTPSPCHTTLPAFS
ncbi:transmembrane and coiled-coil domain 6 [Willisornis vidua]|uniref:Transmembrane and coiled-coil domain 6 n=1 Tax=Willisornis vidua TaxID=1566151 RepID=A0ABQ9DW10_9PASS|nr:transmembrane and coiled-coil domain 6 [Willisornis vidua]